MQFIEIKIDFINREYVKNIITRSGLSLSFAGSTLVIPRVRTLWFAQSLDDCLKSGIIDCQPMICG